MQRNALVVGFRLQVERLHDNAKDQPWHGLKMAVV
jgi:hypothetical protein